jgi:hypothetical protein
MTFKYILMSSIIYKDLKNPSQKAIILANRPFKIIRFWPERQRLYAVKIKVKYLTTLRFLRLSLCRCMIESL